MSQYDPKFGDGLWGLIPVCANYGTVSDAKLRVLGYCVLIGLGAIGIHTASTAACNEGRLYCLGQFRAFISRRAARSGCEGDGHFRLLAVGCSLGGLKGDWEIQYRKVGRKMRTATRIGFWGMVAGLAFAAVPAIGHAGSVTVGNSLSGASSSPNSPDALGSPLPTLTYTPGTYNGGADVGQLSIMGTTSDYYPSGTSGAQQSENGSFAINVYFSSAGVADSSHSTMNITWTGGSFVSNDLTSMSYALSPSGSNASGAMFLQFGQNTGLTLPGANLDSWINLANVVGLGSTPSTLSNPQAVFGTVGWHDQTMSETANVWAVPLPKPFEAGIPLLGIGATFVGLLRHRNRAGQA